MRKIQLWPLGLTFLVSLLVGNTAWAGEPSVSINRGEITTKTRSVVLSLIPATTAQYVKISHSADFSGVAWEPFFSERSWVLASGPGTKTVYVMFRDRTGSVSPATSDTINLSLPATTTLDFTINSGALETGSRYVTLVLNYSDGIESISVSNVKDEFEFFTPVQKTASWILPAGSGEKTIYVKYFDGYGNSKIVSKKIRYTQPGRYLKEGTLLKGQGDTVYYYGYDGRVHAFLHNSIYHSWFKDFSDLLVVSQVKLREYQVGNPVCMRPGTWLLRFHNSARVYAVEPACTLRPLRSEVEAYILYGADWKKRIMAVDPFYEIFYRVKDLTSFNRVDDYDRDGIDRRQENMYGSSDSRVDSDFDGVSDYEEIIYWFSDPMLADTDGDRDSDGEEILHNQSPVGFSELKKVPENTYEYPIGSIVYDLESKSHVYRHTNGLFYAYSQPKKTKSKDSDNIVPFSENFIIRPTLLVPFTKSKTATKILPEFLLYPVTQQGNGFLAQ